MKVGQKIYIKTQNNAARYSGSKIIETTINKVGRKYFEVDALYGIKFEIGNMLQKTNFCVDYKAYLSKEEIENELEKTKLVEIIRKCFGSYNEPDYTLEQLRQVVEILNK